jgi:hypothetical protein
MFIDNLSVAPIALYHLSYTAAVERQNHSIKKYMEICVLYHNVYGTKCSEGYNTHVVFDGLYFATNV